VAITHHDTRLAFANSAQAVTVAGFSSVPSDSTALACVSYFTNSVIPATITPTDTGAGVVWSAISGSQDGVEFPFEEWFVADIPSGVAPNPTFTVTGSSCRGLHAVVVAFAGTGLVRGDWILGDETTHQPAADANSYTVTLQADSGSAEATWVLLTGSRLSSANNNFITGATSTIDSPITETIDNQQTSISQGRHSYKLGGYNIGTHVGPDVFNVDVNDTGTSATYFVARRLILPAAAGGDHWGWAEDSADSWQLV
jgi:hypothetical protein